MTNFMPCLTTPQNRFSKLVSTGACLLISFLANNAKAQSQYFGITAGITSGSTYSWDGPNWSVSGGTSSGPFASTWTQGDFARFYGGSGDTYTVTVNTAESITGMYLNAGAANLSISDAGNGTGSLNILAGAAVDGFGLTQGFLTGAGTLTLNAPITGPGGVEEESGGGHLQLYGNNTYSGGTVFSSSSTYVDYNNNNSFGAGNIGYAATTFSIMENTGPSTVNIANNVQILGGTTGVDFIGNSGTMSGNWNLGGYLVNLRNNGVGTTETLSGVLSGTSSNVTFSGANNGTIVLSGKNTYTGPTVVGVTGDTAISLVLGTANAISSSSSMTLAGGSLSPGGYSQAMGGPLAMSTGSTINFGSGGTFAFADSHLSAWTGDLNLAGWTSAMNGNTLEFGTSASGLTASQLADIEFNGNASTLGEASLNAQGYVVQATAVPEPSTVVLGLMGALALARAARGKLKI